MNYFHKPPFLSRIKDFLNIKKNGVYIDCTFGCGSYSKEILNNLCKDGKIFSFELDPKSFFLGKNLINDNRITLINDNFVNLRKYIHNFNLLNKVDGIIFDLGISSYQLNDSSRGFSYLINGPLDMRINQNFGFSLKEILFRSKKKDILNIIRKYGEDSYAKKISDKIYFYKKINKLNNTFDLSKIIDSVIRRKNNFKNKSRIFQSFRIFINNELEFLSKGLEESLKVLSKNGRIVVVSFHSLEDRIVKNFIKNKSINSNLFLSKVPLTKNQINKLNPVKIINLGKYKPFLQEINDNNRIRSAILRVAKKI